MILLYTGRSQAKSENSGESSASGSNRWNREHVWSKSHGFPSESDTAYTDVHHIRPADESVNSFISEGESARGLISLKAKDGQLVNPLPTLDEIVKRREEEMSKFKDIDNYIVVRTRGVVESQERVRKEIERQKSDFEVPDKYKDIYEKEVMNAVS